MTDLKLRAAGRDHSLDSAQRKCDLRRRWKGWLAACSASSPSHRYCVWRVLRGDSRLGKLQHWIAARLVTPLCKYGCCWRRAFQAAALPAAKSIAAARGRPLCIACIHAPKPKPAHPSPAPHMTSLAATNQRRQLPLKPPPNESN